MTISGLSVYTAVSPNKSTRTKKVCKITPHHMAGNLSIETCGNVFAPSSRQASSNYGIGSDGRIGCYVPEEYRAWTSSNANNDQQAITIEVANDTLAPTWTVSDAAWDSLVDLCVDICSRYNFTLEWTGDANGSLTNHDMFASTNCPGPYLKSRMAELANLVNARLGNGGSTSQPQETPKPTPPVVTNDVSGGTYTCVVDLLNVRNAPTLNSSSVATYSRGQTVNLDNWSTSADGYIWGRYTSYSGATRYVAVRTAGGTEYLSKFGGNSSNNSSNSSSSNTGSIAGGTYIVRASKLNVRDAPSTSANIVASYSAGQQINAIGTDTRIADGYVWGHYTSYSGATRWVAMGPVSNPTEYLSK